MDYAIDTTFLLDGATGSELDRRGIDIGMPLWSANALLKAPDILKRVHIAYLEAGAQAIITNTFRTHERSLAKAGMGERAKELTSKAVDIARSACNEVNSAAFVFGSVAPLEDCYSPKLSPDATTCEQEHGNIIQHLVDAGVDLVLIETMCSAHEAIAAAQAAEKHAKDAWAISFCVSTTDVGVLLDGTPLSEITPHLAGASFIGINCVSAPKLAAQVTYLRSLLPDDMAVAAYGNVGYADGEGSWVNTDAIDPNAFAEYAMDWVKAGANIVGGCCGTTPETIAAIRGTL